MKQIDVVDDYDLKKLTENQIDTIAHDLYEYSGKINQIINEREAYKRHSKRMDRAMKNGWCIVSFNNNNNVSVLWKYNDERKCIELLMIQGDRDPNEGEIMITIEREFKMTNHEDF